MSVSIPDGYVTRPAASKVYNRSKRALERDLDDAYTANDEDVLAAFQLVTNDDSKRGAREVTTELVEKLKKDGMNPVWCVDEVWLESTYGRKGETKPEQPQELRPHFAKKPTNAKHDRGGGTKPEARGTDGEEDHSDADSSYLPDDILFLKERIRTLEREKMEEIERHERRETKLFQQLEVKDKQISAWDELSQGLTKALATGQLMPTAISSPASAGSSSQDSTAADNKREQTRTVVVAESHNPAAAGVQAASGKKTEKGTGRKTRPRRLKAKAQPKKKRPTQGKEKSPEKKTKKRSWLRTPITELLSRR
jgi:hypothetical protein